ncbi:hypothetical protein M011DRAFT_224419 [Sporormia fimetaria CBS 119925]|uniref:Uncharacterized protein n=1 Tax=Sporormia fimetaria CBS 119925 TaxID=1340428 RepID=A0A6A6V0Q5_9PLEO|nr:hypothetical protein M011DRAFT_224419 [Sporormia fimetaria CBS 119925]
MCGDLQVWVDGSARGVVMSSMNVFRVQEAGFLFRDAAEAGTGAAGERTGSQFTDLVVRRAVMGVHMEAGGDSGDVGERCCAFSTRATLGLATHAATPHATHMTHCASYLPRYHGCCMTAAQDAARAADTGRRHPQGPLHAYRTACTQMQSKFPRLTSTEAVPRPFGIW